jgi:glutamate-1-semialdehyde aminotransferase
MIDWRNSTGAELYCKAKTLIPGGTQLLSKRPEMFLPDLWPAYYSRAKGCEVWDLDSNHFFDMTTCGIGACLLGFADPDVNAAVKRSVDSGSMATLNSPAEVELAELLIELHPWAEMVRYARTGGEVMSIAIRIARAASGRDKIAICGYHGWHDWYLAANLAEDGMLDGHLLPGLEPNGVPKALRGTTLPFRYNNIEELDAILAEHPGEIAAVVMEPVRHDLPDNGFLEEVKASSEKAGAVLIFDEITAGWRFHTGGIHMSLGVEPDVAVFAKSISNGFPMGAVIGRSEVMDAAQSSFISSTYWTESVGPSAAVATIAKMRAVNLPEKVRVTGERILKAWKELGEKHDIPVAVHGLPPLCSFAFECDDAQMLKTAMTYEMLNRGFLANTAIYPILSHGEDVVDKYLGALDEVFGILKKSLNGGTFHVDYDLRESHKGFARLN